MNKFLVMPIVIISVFVAGCSNQGVTVENIGQSDFTESNEVIEEFFSYNTEEVAEHASKDDCWIVIDDKVYDVTEFVNGHPGGEAILEGCGIDATILFETRPMGSGKPHSPKARDLMKDYYIGELV